MTMNKTAEVESVRRELLNRLPSDIREALCRNDDIALASALAALSEEERPKVDDIITQLARVPVQVPTKADESLLTEALDSPDHELVHAQGLPPAPEQLYRIVDG